MLYAKYCFGVLLINYALDLHRLYFPCKQSDLHVFYNVFGFV